MSDDSPILIVPYMWIGDFVRCHTVVRLLRARFPGRPIDMLTTAMAAPLVDYMPGVRKGIVFDLPRKRLALSQHRALADLLRPERYGDALIMPRTWNAALAPFLAGLGIGLLIGRRVDLGAVALVSALMLNAGAALIAKAFFKEVTNK